MTYYGTRFGCRFGWPHNMARLGENPQQIWERCKLCGKTFRWNKGYRGRIKNAEYVVAHVRQFAQRIGATKRVFFKLYEPTKTIIYI